MCGSDDDEDGSQCVVVTMMRMVVSVCGSDDDEDGSRCVVVMVMRMVVSVW